MAVPVAILGFVGKEFGKKVLSSVVAEYFPDDKTFEKTVEASLEQLNRKIDNIAQDTAYQRIQAVKDVYIAKSYFLNKELVPYLRLEAKGKSYDMPSLTENAKKVSESRSKLGISFEQGLQVLNERINSCDLPARRLFETLQCIAALRLVCLSWEYFLYRNIIPSTRENDIRRIQDDYKDFRAYSIKTIGGIVNEICDARTAKIHFSEEVRMGRTKADPDLGPESAYEFPEYVKYVYKDTFSSQYADDPFRGDEINKCDELELKPWDKIWLFENKKIYRLCKVNEELVKYKKEHEEHLRAVIALNNKYVRDPAKAFLDAMDKLPKDIT